jgi:hypothetical protein
MMYDPEQDTVDVLLEAGATRVVPTGRNKFRVGSFPSAKRVMLAYYRRYGGWQFEFDSTPERDAQVSRFSREGVPASAAPDDSTQRRMAVGHDRRLALRLVQTLAGVGAPAAEGGAQPRAAPVAAQPGVRPSAPAAQPAPAPAPSSMQTLWDHNWTKRDVEELSRLFTQEQLAEFAANGYTPDLLRRFLTGS